MFLTNGLPNSLGWTLTQTTKSLLSFFFKKYQSPPFLFTHLNPFLYNFLIAFFGFSGVSLIFPSGLDIG